MSKDSIKSILKGYQSRLNKEGAHSEGCFEEAKTNTGVPEFFKLYPLNTEKHRTLLKYFLRLKHFSLSQKINSKKEGCSDIQHAERNDSGITQIKSPINIGRLARPGDVVWFFKEKDTSEAKIHNNSKQCLKEDQKENTPGNLSFFGELGNISGSKTHITQFNFHEKEVRPAVVQRVENEFVTIAFFDCTKAIKVPTRHCCLFLEWLQRVLLNPQLAENSYHQLEMESALAYYRHCNPWQISLAYRQPGQSWSDYATEIIHSFGSTNSESSKELRFAPSVPRKRSYAMMLDQQADRSQEKSVGSVISRRATEGTVEAVLAAITAEPYNALALDQLLVDLLPTEHILRAAVRANNAHALTGLLAKVTEHNMSLIILARHADSRASLLHEAVDAGAINVLPVLTLAMHQALDWGTSSGRQMRSVRSPLTLTDKFGKTALHVAAQKGYPDAISLLVWAGADVEARDGDGYTPLLWCAESGAGKGHAKCAELLLKAGAKVNSSDRRGMTTLFWAVSYGLNELVQVLISNNGHYYEPLMSAPKPMSCGNRSPQKKNTSEWATAGGHLTIKQRSALGEYAKDISLKLEVPVAVKLGCMAAEDALSFPHFGYILDSIGNPDMADRDVKGRGCDCKTDCRNNPNCRCIRENGQRSPYGADGTLDLERTVIYECGNWCACVDCNLVQSQMGLQQAVHVSYVDKKGWGLFYDGEDYMKKGTFLCCYVGELITLNEYEEREMSRLAKGDESTYAIIVEHRGGNSHFVIDSRYVGNASRLMNHSCQSNLELRKVYTSRQYPSLAFFASREIDPGEELTWNYDRVIDSKKTEKNGVKCMCGADVCRGYL